MQKGNDVERERKEVNYAVIQKQNLGTLLCFDQRGQQNRYKESGKGSNSENRRWIMLVTQ